MEQMEGQASMELGSETGRHGGEDQSAYVWRGQRPRGEREGTPTPDWNEGPPGIRPELRGEEVLHDLSPDHSSLLVFRLLRCQEWLPGKHKWLPLLDQLHF